MRAIQACNMKSVFRLELNDNQPKVQRTRRSHTKSRGGCKLCKQQRQKCDEVWPTCTRCKQRGYQCSLGDNPPGTIVQSKVPQSPPDTLANDLAVTHVREQIENIMAITGASTQWPSYSKALRDLQHFQSSTASTLGFGHDQFSLESFISQPLWQFPYLLHMVLAVSNSHLKRLHPGGSTGQQLAAVGEADHCQIALQLYRTELELVYTLEDVPSEKIESLLTTTLLSVIYVFAIDDHVDPDAFIQGDRKTLTDIFTPMVSTNGFRALRDLSLKLSPDSRWFRMLTDADDEFGTYSSTKPGIDGMPPAFVALCGMDNTSDSESNIYHTQLRLLTPLLKLSPDRRNLPRVFAYIGRCWNYIQPHYLDRDPVCLLLLVWWLCLLRQFDMWWLTSRVQSQTIAIVRYLRTLRDPRLIPFMEFPETFGEADYSWIWD